MKFKSGDVCIFIDHYPGMTENLSLFSGHLCVITCQDIDTDSFQVEFGETTGIVYVEELTKIGVL